MMRKQFATGCKCSIERPLAAECQLHGNGSDHEWSAARRGTHECLNGCGMTMPWTRSAYEKILAASEATMTGEAKP